MLHAPEIQAKKKKKDILWIFYAADCKLCIYLYLSCWGVSVYVQERKIFIYIYYIYIIIYLFFFCIYGLNYLFSLVLPTVSTKQASEFRDEVDKAS